MDGQSHKSYLIGIRVIGYSCIYANGGSCVAYLVSIDNELIAFIFGREKTTCRLKGSRVGSR